MFSPRVPQTCVMLDFACAAAAVSSSKVEARQWPAPPLCKRKLKKARGMAREARV